MIQFKRGVIVKKKPFPPQSKADHTQEIALDHGRGVIKDNALKAVVTSSLFRTRVVKAQKGKGSFKRQAKHKGQEPCTKGNRLFFVQGFSFITA
ncbi:ribosome alternative rescue factor ArfA [Vibrio metschnikovii]|uniref:Ribosome alternative rescue factor ArfA n=1 Tax=Vibrio metschnikovii TaxID=28172 RepID=A0A9X0RCB1_VIBME|nr:ribosome alternative rescue factor ArfA [Vibrio metschnikovii]EKO3582985.1 ribosome alternative rescue factor ArfA [Vibrio metschnikovii]EKO3708199.1 ribosome alternative rescue factor ArfA [Vibrio metschnikovii]MBC5852250.1 ribosome alternative rescue factor ArfA [Vibrio metschnikovii]